MANENLDELLERADNFKKEADIAESKNEFRTAINLLLRAGETFEKTAEEYEKKGALFARRESRMYKMAYDVLNQAASLEKIHGNAFSYARLVMRSYDAIIKRTYAIDRIGEFALKMLE